MPHFRPLPDDTHSGVDPRVRAIFWRCYLGAMLLVILAGIFWGLA
jgi:hypothetical protein